MGVLANPVNLYMETGKMANVGEILSNVGNLLVAIGAVVVLFKTAGLITALSDRIKEWKV